MDGDLLVAKVQITKIIFKNDSNWGIVAFKILEYMPGNKIINLIERPVAKGIMPEVVEGGEYCLEAVECTDPKYGKQFNIKKMYTSLLLDEGDKHGQRMFLESLFTDNQIQSMYDTLDDPYQTFLDQDVESLVKIKGVGFKTANLWLNKFKRNLDNSRVFVELSDYGLTSTMINKLLLYYGSPDLVIQTVREHPYSLIDVNGIGWATCDAMAEKGGIDKHSPERVAGFLKHCLKEKAEEGYLYLYTNEQLLPLILDTLGEDLPDEPILEAFRILGDKLWWSEDQSKVGLRYYINLEKKIAKKLIELRNAPNNFKYDGWEQIIKKKEREQGWEYTEQQYEGIRAALENQVVIISGYGGTGKSSIVSGVIEILKNYNFAQCALSGRAAARLTEVTGISGYTIHRLLGYPKGDTKDGFFYNEDNLLDFDVVIVDEISMVDGELFWDLIRSLKVGTKLILLGDVGQLESIGCSSIANDLIASIEIKSVVLDKIHRQAEASAIITDSIRARHGEQIIDKDFTGVKVEGQLQDLTYDCYSDANNTFYKISEWVSRLLEQGIPMEDVQVIVPIKEKQAGTWNLNLALQEIYNPLKFGERQILVDYGNDKKSYFRVGDKVINILNCYEARTYTGQWLTNTKEEALDMGEITPVFNGNMGIIQAINPKRQEIIVDFTGIGKILITKDMLKSIMLGYAVTVHKCQGSEFPYVIIGMDFTSYTLLSRQMVYTAITRAEKHCYIVAQNSALRYAVAQNSVSKKQTILQEALYNEAHPKMIF